MNRLSALLLCLALTTPALAGESAHHRVQRPDETWIDYTLTVPDAESRGLLLLAQGSGCLPTAKNRNLAATATAFEGYTVVTVEKYGVAPDADINDGYEDCPVEFLEGYTMSQRISDNLQVLAELEAAYSGDENLVMLGGSEGGLLVAALSAQVDVDAAIILSSGMGLAFSDIVLISVPPEAHPMIEAIFEEARANPQSAEVRAGSSLRFWADMLSQRGIDHMLGNQTPYLIIQGGRDQSSPLEASRITAEKFAEVGQCNLTYWELPGLDHAMADPSGNPHMEQILAAAAQWAEAPLTAC